MEVTYKVISVLTITMYIGNTTTQHMDVFVNDCNEYMNDGHDGYKYT